MGFFIFCVGCKTARMEKTLIDPISSLSKIENLSMELTSNDIINTFGTTNDQGTNAKDKFYVMGFPEGKNIRRYTFAFCYADKKLVSKSISINDNEKMASIDFWKKRYPSANFEVKNQTTDYGHFQSTDNWIEINELFLLSVLKNKITDITWIRNKNVKCK